MCHIHISRKQIKKKTRKQKQKIKTKTKKEPLTMSQETLQWDDMGSKAMTDSD